MLLLKDLKIEEDPIKKMGKLEEIRRGKLEALTKIKFSRDSNAPVSEEDESPIVYFVDVLDSLIKIEKRRIEKIKVNGFP